MTGLHVTFEEVPELEAIAREQVRPLKRSEYDRLVQLGAFLDERLELLRGELVRVSPIGPPHAAVSTRLTEILVRSFANRATVRVQLPFAASDDSEPEPDFAVVPRGEYEHDHPSTAYFLVEVAESSLAIDSGPKLRLYAECGVPEYWVVNLVDRTIVVHREPADGGYGRVDVLGAGDVLRPERFPDLAIPVDDVLR